jgi:hypothetical protein
MYTPVAMNCAPCFDIVCKSLSPVLSMDVISLRSTMHFRLSSARWVFFQILLSSLTHNPTKRPCRIHFSSSGVSVLVIFNTSVSFVDESTRSLVGYGGGLVSARTREAISLAPRTPLLAGVLVPCACGLRCHRIRKRPLPSRSSSTRCPARGRR